MILLKKMAAASLMTLSISAAFAAPTAEEAAELGKSLTALGAIKAGNADGTIPAYDGGLCTPVAGYKPKSAKGGWPYVDPFADEKPLYSIDSKNMSEYADKLAEGTKVMLERYPDTFRVDVFPTHRTACFPDYVYKNTIERVMKPKLVGDAPGIMDAHAQFPFPIPKNGFEAMWNGLLRFAGPYEAGGFTQYVVDNSGNVTLSNFSTVQDERRFWDNDLEYSDDMTYWRDIATQAGPPAQAGSKNMIFQYLRADERKTKAWTYIPGQRRVRASPEFTYDTVSTLSGVLLFDEINGFDGRMDKFDFKLLGRQEMIVPYNDYRRFLQPQKELLTAHHVAPEGHRWELHRVWVVEGTLKEGERHVQKRKKFYLDEDSWAILLYTSFDHQDKPHHYFVSPVYQEYDKPQLRSNAMYDLYDLTTGNYTAQVFPGPKGTGYIKLDEPWPANTYTPGGLAGAGIR